MEKRVILAMLAALVSLHATSNDLEDAECLEMAISAYLEAQAGQSRHGQHVLCSRGKSGLRYLRVGKVRVTT